MKIESKGIYILLIVTMNLVFGFDALSDPIDKKALLPVDQHYVTDIIVKFQDSIENNGQNSSIDYRDASKSTLSKIVSSTLGINATHNRTLATGADLFRLSTKISIDTSLDYSKKLSKDSDIVYAEPDFRVTINEIPNDPLYSDQWHYNDPFSGIGIGVTSAWEISTGLDVVVAVIDTGYRPHPDLIGNILPGYDMLIDDGDRDEQPGRDSDATDPGNWRLDGECGEDIPSRDSSWHGTHVAGTISAVTNNALGVSGVAHGAKIVPVRAFGRCGGKLSDWADATIWAVGENVPNVDVNPHPAHVINMSFGGPSDSCPFTAQEAINIARTNNATIVVSAGNNSMDASEQNPANCDGVVVVTAVTRKGLLAPYSNIGSVVDIAAPGGDIATLAENGVLSTSNSGLTEPETDNYQFYNGTSMAAPHVAGVAALIYSLSPNVTPDLVEEVLISSSLNFFPPGICPECTFGKLNAVAPLIAISGNDIDMDGVPDTTDNCREEVNADQRDTDADGFGNICDPDLNNDLVVNFEDFGLIAPYFLSFNPDADFNGDGVVNFSDINIFSQFFLLTPGPGQGGSIPPETPEIQTVITDESIAGIGLDYDGNYELEWSQSSMATVYYLRELRTSPSILEQVINKGLSTTHSIVDKPNGRYEYSVMACNSNELCSEYGNPRVVIVERF